MTCREKPKGFWYVASVFFELLGGAKVSSELVMLSSRSSIVIESMIYSNELRTARGLDETLSLTLYCFPGRMSDRLSVLNAVDNHVTSSDPSGITESPITESVMLSPAKYSENKTPIVSKFEPDCGMMRPVRCSVTVDSGGRSRPVPVSGPTSTPSKYEMKLTVPRSIPSSAREG